MCTLVVAAETGKDLVEPPAVRERYSEGLCGTRIDAAASVIVETFSFATCVMAAAFGARGHDPLYQQFELLDPLSTPERG